ncbi:hypothetical protein VDG1235_337 [Verrucomicrobiia bacterium DG1235]|nr:hypothetical protein VDG1235_337 [Verrucomicrobiae bacterium DG1235]
MNSAHRLLALAVCLTFSPLAELSAQATVSGTVSLPPPPPTDVIAKRYNMVSDGSTLTPSPPIAIVWLEGASTSDSATPTANAEISQENFVFEPALLPIQVGTTVAFPNHDEEYHNVFSYSKAKRFDLGRYMPDEKPVPTQTFNKPGQIILRCDVHEHMKAVILVLETPYFTSSDTEGSFTLADIPKGEYTLKAWVDTKTTFEKAITIDDETEISVSFD